MVGEEMSDARTTPRIGVSWVRAGQEETHHCVQAIRAAGGEPVVLAAYAPSWTAQIQTLEGIVFTGGEAVDPRRYGEINEGLCETVIEQRDELELEALAFCRDRCLPVLGVCRGMQFLNVALGGRMLQDIVSGPAVEHRADGTMSRFHTVEVTTETRLAAIRGASGPMHVNSSHHQGLRAEHLAPGVRLSAVAPDGIVEGIETSDDAFLIGVQFHPEKTDEVPEMRGLFTTLTARARAR